MANSVTTSAYKIWLRPGRTPAWGRVKILRQTYCGVDQYEVIVRGDGLDLEHLVRHQSEDFVMFERIQRTDVRSPFLGSPDLEEEET